MPLGRTPQLPSRVATVIASEIMEGRLPHGARLPTEQALASKFGVSRSVIREAIARLRSDGMVQSRQGVGAFVVSNQESATLRIDADLMSDRLVFRNVFELRAILEIRAAGLAALRADDEQRAVMSDAMMRMRTAVNWLIQGVPADLEFHRAVAAGSGNPYMAMMVAFLSGQMRESIMFMRENRSDVGGAMIATNIAEHAAIHDAIMARDPETAIAAMRLHITNAAHRLGYDLSDGVFLWGGG
ncbi:MAG TPA: FadR/GntR family transcriptional regulator [Bauldia sp.]|nr:FadR/GntR family transcriptional regulator [Bauldia sp.]